jgi:hypothetical protein
VKEPMRLRAQEPYERFRPFHREHATVLEFPLHTIKSEQRLLAGGFRSTPIAVFAALARSASNEKRNTAFAPRSLPYAWRFSAAASDDVRRNKSTTNERPTKATSPQASTREQARLSAPLLF